MSCPNIINLRTVDNIEKWLEEPNNEYIGRPTNKLNGSKWKNTYKISRKNSRNCVIQKFEKRLHRKPNLINIPYTNSKEKYLGAGVLQSGVTGRFYIALQGIVLNTSKITTST